MSILEEGDADDPAAGDLWIITGKGLSRLDRDQDTFQSYGPSDGLPPTELHRHSHKARSGEFLIGSTDGVIAFDPADLTDDSDIPPIVFTGFLLANEPVDIGGGSPLQQAIDQTDEITLSYADRLISFEFAALSYRAPGRNRYRYRLEGFEEDWIEVDSSRRLVTYTNLDPGEYTFEVLGSNSAGVWNEKGASIGVTIIPPWWQTGWFRATAALFVIGLVAGAFVWQRQGARRRQHQLEIQVGERTRELKAAKEKAEVANQAKSTFLATMSHELRTPLNAILGFARSLARSEELKPEHRRDVGIIQRSGDHLLEMIDEILSLARIEAGRTQLQRASFDLVRHLEDVGQIMGARAQARQLRFDIELDPSLPRIVVGDAGKIRQILINLLGNAVKFTEEGRVCLRARARTLEDDPTRLLLRLDVEDSGPGIPAERRDSIFETFEQGPQPGGAEPGTGLGLTICQSLVDLMDGRIDVTSEPGQGSLFSVTISLVTADESASEVHERRAIGLEPGETEWRILVVDDNADNRALLMSMLERIGFAVREAVDGSAAVEAFREWVPHLICMDMRMPVLDGYAATGAIRELPGGEDVKIIAVTASAFDEERDQILGAGCDDMVRKPIREEEALDAIARHLGVEYVYADAAPARRPEQRIDVSSEMLAELPEESLEELRQATRLLDRDAIAGAIEEIAVRAPDTARGLRQLLDDLRIGRIRELLDELT